LDLRATFGRLRGAEEDLWLYGRGGEAPDGLVCRPAYPTGVTNHILMDNRQKQTNKQKHTNKQKTQTNKHTNKQTTNQNTNKQANKTQTNKQTNTQTNKNIMSHCMGHWIIAHLSAMLCVQG
jgi:mannitol-specific phosphotransferase system IIBC component